MIGASSCGTPLIPSLRALLTDTADVYAERGRPDIPPAISLASQLTVVAPAAKTEPEAGVQDAAASASCSR